MTQKIHDFKIARASKDLKSKVRNFYTYEEIFDIDSAREFMRSLRVRDANPNEKDYSREDLFVHFSELLDFLKFSKVHETSNQGSREVYRSGKTEISLLDAKTEVWAHPAGILLKMSTGYYSEGKKVGSMSCSLEIDGGNSYNLICPLRVSSQGSMSGRSSPSGSWIKMTTAYRLSMDELLNFLGQAQEMGYLLPFKDWDLSNYLDHFYPSDVFTGNENDLVSPEKIFEIKGSSFEEPPDLKKAVAKKIKEISQKNEIQNIEGLSDVFLSLNADHEQRVQFKNPSPFDWRLCEFALESYDRLCAYSLVRYPSFDDKETLKRWFEYCCSGNENCLLDGDWTKRVAGGFSLLQAVISQSAYERNDEENRRKSKHEFCFGDLLKEKLKTIPLEFLQDLSFNPDSSGKNLPIFLYQARVSAEFFSDVNRREVTRVWDDCVDILAGRFNEQNVPLPNVFSSSVSPLGLWFKSYQNKNQFCLGHASTLREAYDVLDGLEKKGFPVNREWNIQNPCAVDYKKQYDDHGALIVKKPHVLLASTLDELLVLQPFEEQKDLKFFMKEVLACQKNTPEKEVYSKRPPRSL